MAYFECLVGGGGSNATITVSYDSSFYNKTMTCSNGVDTYTQTTTSSGVTEFEVDSAGTWIVSCNGVSVTVEVVLNYAVSMLITKNVNVYGAAYAQISFTDAVGSKVVTLDGNGEGNVNISILPPSQAITFTDTNVSKNPTDLSQNFSKSITITNNTTDIYIMPDGIVVYWYGWNNPTYELKYSSSVYGYLQSNANLTSNANSLTGVWYSNGTMDRYTKVKVPFTGKTAIHGIMGETSNIKHVSNNIPSGTTEAYLTFCVWYGGTYNARIYGINNAVSGYYSVSDNVLILLDNGTGAANGMTCYFNAMWVA